MQAWFWTAAVLIGLAFWCEYMDATLGMGYGTALTPLLMIMGFSPMQIIPAALFSQLLSGLLAGVLHHSQGNVDFGIRQVHLNQGLRNGVGWRMRVLSFRRAVPLHLKVALLLATCSIVGTVAAVLIAVNIPAFWLKLYIGILVFAMGVLIVVCRHRKFTFSWRKVMILGSVAAFNKGMSGGGYGPVVTSGQILSGINGRSAVGITSLAEGLTCLTGFAMYLLIGENSADWPLTMYISCGAVLSVPFSAFSVRRLNLAFLKNAIAAMTLTLGATSILMTLLSSR